MALFGSRKKEFSGRPTDNSSDDANYATNDTTGPNTLHKRNPVATTAADAQGPAYADAAVGRQTRSGGGFFSRRNRGGSAGGASSDEEARFAREQNVGGVGMGAGGLNDRELAAQQNQPLAGTTGLGATGAGVATGGPTYGSGGHHFVGRGGEDMEGDAMTVARGKVRAAENAEQEALRMLAAARAAVQEAQEHVERLAQEAEEDTRRAAAKQEAVKGLRNDTSHLGHAF